MFVVFVTNCKILFLYVINLAVFIMLSKKENSIFVTSNLKHDLITN